MSTPSLRCYRTSRPSSIKYYRAEHRSVVFFFVYFYVVYCDLFFFVYGVFIMTITRGFYLVTGKDVFSTSPY